MNIKRMAAPVIVLAMASSLAACGTDSGNATGNAPSSGGTTTVRIANLPVVATMVLNVADQQGFLRENGIQAEITKSFELGTFIPALGKQYDIVMTTPTDFLSAATKGFDIVATQGDWADGAGVISAKAKTIKDLEGMKIATNSLTGLQYAMLKDSLAKNGVKAELIQVPFASQPDQLKAGAVDAATVPEPYSTSLTADSKYKRVFTPVEEATGVPHTLTGWYSTTREFAKKNPQVIAGWNKALGQAIDWINAHEADFRKLLEKDLKLSPELATSIKMPIWTKKVTVEDLKVYVEPLIRQGQLQDSARNLDLSKYAL